MLSGEVLEKKHMGTDIRYGYTDLERKESKTKGVERKQKYNPTRQVTAGLLITYCFFMSCCTKSLW